jgi:tetratricopeptide (TPR) repeat protein
VRTELNRIRSVGREALDTLHESNEGALVAARRPDGCETILFVPRTPEDGVRERERLDALCGPGIPSARPATGESFEALVLVGAEGARPLPVAAALPDTVWRPGLVRLLSALSQAHGRGWTHGRIARGYVLADPSGGFWLWGWGGGRPVQDPGPFRTGFDDVGRDLRDTGIALVRHLAGADAETGEDVDPATLARARDRVDGFDRELARVLVRMVTVDPRESYLSATEVLTDLGEADESLPDPWARLEFVGRRGIVRRIVARAERAGTRGASLASFTISGAPGTGRSRLLAEVAREARARGLVVLQAAGGAAQRPWGALTSFARQLLARIPPGHPLREEPGVRLLVGDTSATAGRESDLESGDGAAAALEALVREAFRGARGLLLLDDEDALPGHALRAWRSLARHVAAASGGPDPLRVLVVRTSVAAPEPDDAAPGEGVELDDLSRRHLAAMLASLLTEEGQAPALAAEIESLVGGRPADVVEHLRDLVARRALVPVGRRFALGAGADSARPGGTDAFRRAAETAGREGRALGEVLAVADRLRLPRDVLAALAELPAHRLNAAAEAALRAGLVARDGATWRVRTESLRARLEHALPDERRRGLHHEILVRLLDAPQPDWPAIATHGRAAGDSRAADWTQQSLAILRREGRFEEAAVHFDDACAVLGPGAITAEMRLAHADTLLHAGRLDDALRVAEQVHADPRATPREHGEAALALARLHRYDQAWSKALAVELPVDCGDPMVLARMRLVRGIALILSGRRSQGERERRLALSELPSPASGGSEFEYWQLAFEFNALADRRDIEEARRAAIERLRHPLSRANPLQFALDLVGVANTCRLLAEHSQARAILRRARAVAAERLGGNALVETWALSTLCQVNTDDSKRARRIRLLEATAFAAARTGGRTLALNKRIQLIDALCSEGAITPYRYAELRRIAANVDDLFPDVAAMSIHRLVMSLAHCGLHVVLERIDRIARAPQATEKVRDWSALALALSSLVLASPPESQGDALPTTAAEAVDQAARLGNLVRAASYVPPTAGPTGLVHSETSAVLLALCVRRGLFRTPAWPEEWTFDAVVALIDHLGPEMPWVAPLPASLLVCARDRLSGEEIEVLRARLAAAPPQFPTPLEWLRHLAAARECFAEGRLASALRHMALARLRARAVDRPESGTCREAARRSAVECIEAHGVVLRPAAAPAVPAGAATEPPVAVRDWPSWTGALAAVAASRSVLVSGRDARELEVFADVLAQVVPVRELPLARPGATWEATEAVLVRFPERWDTAESDAARAAARAHRDAGGRLVVLTVAPPDELRGPERKRAAWLQLCGTVVDLGPALADPAARRAAFAALLRSRAGAGVGFDPAVVAEIEGYSWPGGVSELESVVAELAAPGVNRVDESSLERIGWRRRIDLSVGGELHPHEQVVLRWLERCPWSSSADVSRGVSKPSRTTVRLLTRLVETGRVVRRGAGRATRYALADGSLPPPVARG